GTCGGLPDEEARGLFHMKHRQKKELFHVKHYSKPLVFLHPREDRQSDPAAQTRVQRRMRA
ncbi:MAG: hypothetical protein II680_14975, partial [Clostridia bacterium]|nr:hypothetical protein [Clostridia bacterium]